MDGHVARKRNKERVSRILVEQYERNRPSGRFSLVCVLRLKTCFIEVGEEGTGWINLAQDRGNFRAIMNAVINLPPS